MVPLKIVSNVSRFKPVLHLNRVLADLNRGLNSLNSISGQISFYLCVISSDPPCKDGNDWFTTEPLKLFSVQKSGRLNCIEFLPITCCLTGLKNLIFIKVQRIRMYQFQMNNKTTLCTDVYMYVPSLTFYTHSVSTKNIVFFMMPLWYVCMIYFLIMGGFLAIENYAKFEFPL